VTPAIPKDKSFADISKVLKEHFEPKPIRAAERYYFQRRLQVPGESIAEYIAELRRLSIHCKFDGYLEDELCDQLVCGLRNDNMRKMLFAEEKLTFQKAFELTQICRQECTAVKGDSYILGGHLCLRLSTLYHKT
jgi:hypothetical protein